MSYRDDFYIRDHIVGYTADDNDITKTPTVYFESDTEFGHITQVHKRQENTGRGRVRNKLLFIMEGEECFLYKYNSRSERARGKIRLHERYEAISGSRAADPEFELALHLSRNEFVTDLTDEAKDTLAAVIGEFPLLKKKEADKQKDADGNQKDESKEPYIPLGPYAILAADYIDESGHW